MEGPQDPQQTMAGEQDDVQVNGGETPPQSRNILQNTTPLFLQHCIYLGKYVVVTYYHLIHPKVTDSFIK